MYKNYFRYLFFSILFFITLNVVFQIAISENPNFNIYDLALNLVSEFAGMIFTVLVFNEFIMYRQRLVGFSKTRQLLNELQELLDNITYTFEIALKEFTDQSTNDIWNVEVFELIREKIIITDSNKNVFPNIPWYLFFALQGEKILKKCENIKMQYDDVLEANVSSKIFYLINDSDMLVNLSNIKKIFETDLITNNNRNANLGSYFLNPTDKDLTCITELNKWFLDTNTALQKSVILKEKLQRIYKIAYPGILILTSTISIILKKYETAKIFGATTVIYFTVGFLIKRFNRR